MNKVARQARFARRKSFQSSKARDHRRHGRKQCVAGNPRFSAAKGCRLPFGTRHASRLMLAEATADLSARLADEKAEEMERVELEIELLHRRAELFDRLDGLIDAEEEARFRLEEIRADKARLTAALEATRLELEAL